MKLSTSEVTKFTKFKKEVEREDMDFDDGDQVISEILGDCANC